ncbi:MAG: RagB/SusD family nutrient uptake outer membrane protein [Bacteroidales bacterium]|nr:RagB/SusD family nutrient uptake outer membrane protein [Bacteroidales bacterium]
MKNIYIRIIFCAGLVMLMSCSQISLDSDFLGSRPESSGADISKMFSSASEADKVLNEAYRNLPYGIPTSLNNKLGGNILESLTDLCQSFRDNVSDGPMKLYYNGSLSASTANTSAAYHFAHETDWTSIRYAWLFIENASAVKDYPDMLLRRRTAEAKTIIALSYFEMLRFMGGLPWLDHAVDVNEPMNFPRQTFAVTVDNIVSLLDEAIPDLAWKQDSVNDGRMTKAGAMALKFKVLQWAASPAFNSETRWHEDADEYTCYGNYDASRWDKALAAAQDFFNEVASRGEYSLIMPEDDSHRSRRLAYRKAYYDRGGSEVLISIRHGFGPETHNAFINQRPYSGPTLNYVDMFPWADGSDFPEDFDWSAPSRQPFFQHVDGQMVPTRDPRLYENVACPGETYCDGTSAPVYTNHASYKDGSGFLIMKYILQENSDRAGRPVQWAYLRLAEMMLDYAEVINEAGDGPDAPAYSMVNQVRARVGLNPLPVGLSKDEFREAVLREKALELGFEEVRWFDLVRHDRQEDFTKTLYGLRSKGNDLTRPTSFTFEKVALTPRFWAENWDKKWYLAPVPQDEINKKYGMTQNPGW